MAGRGKSGAGDPQGDADAGSAPLVLKLAGGRRLPMELRYSARRTVLLSVVPGPRVIVYAPAEMPLERVMERINTRTRWLERHIERFSALALLAPKRQAGQGDRAGAVAEVSLPYLGRRLALSVELCPPGEERVEFSQRSLRIFAPAKRGSRGRVDQDAVDALIEQWYVERARLLLPKRMAREHARLASSLPEFRDTPTPTLKVRAMQSRWGSCGGHGRMSLSSELMRAAPGDIDYVIVHELCHLVEANHSPRFYSLLSRAMPDWQARKARLEAGAI